MTPAVFDQTTIDIKAGRLTFRATGSVQKFDGFLKVYQEGRDEKPADGEDDEEERNLPLVKEGETLKLNTLTPNQHFTEPPPRYSEATLVKALEEKGIGRPSTYAAIMTTIQDREYVEKIEGRFHPTPLGMTVNDLLVQAFDDIFNTAYTARMEEELDEIEEGKLNWRAALHEFYGKFSVDLEKAAEHIKNVKRMAIPTGDICRRDGGRMVIKFDGSASSLRAKTIRSARTRARWQASRRRPAVIRWWKGKRRPLRQRCRPASFAAARWP